MPLTNPTGLPLLVRGHAISLTTRPSATPHCAASTPMQPTGVMYTPFDAPATIQLATQMNMQRLARGKPVLPLIARDKLACQTLQAVKQKNLQKFQCSLQKQLQGGPDYDQGQHRITDEARKKICKMLLTHKHLESVRQLQILNNEGGIALATLQPGANKIYVLGHGKAGSQTLSMPARNGHSQRITATELAQQLSLGQLPANFRDIRVIACHGADTQVPRSFDPSDLDAAAAPHRGHKAFGQWFSSALAKEGFQQPDVRAYHGLGTMLTTPGGYKQRQLQAHEDGVRQSTVHRVFKPEP